MAQAFVVPTIFTAVDRMSAVVKKAQGNMQRFTNKAEVGVARMERGFRRMTPSLAGINKLLGGFGLLIGGTLILGAMRSIIGTFKDFEQANASLASVMGVTVQQNKALSEDAKRLGSTTAKSATEVVALQEAFARLGFSQKEILNVTESTIAGSIAMNGELAATAELTGAMIRTFDAFSSTNAPEILDQMTVATQKSALNFEKLQTALPIVGGAANAAGIPFSKMLALLGKLSDAGIDASSSATALRNIILESSKQGLSYNKILDKIAGSQDKLTRSNDEFGKRAAVPAAILAKNLKTTTELDSIIRSAAAGQINAGAASAAAAKQLDTLNGSMTILGSAWEGFILSIEDGNGAFSEFLTTSVRVVSEVLSLASGSSKAEESLSAAELRIRSIANTTIFFIKVIAVIVAAYASWFLIIKSIRLGLLLYNIALGISSALSGTAAIAVGANTAALAAYGVVSKVVTAAQWLWNIALTANPIGLIIVAIAALIAAIALLIIFWDDVTEAILGFMNKFPILASMIKFVTSAWDQMKRAFSAGGFTLAIKSVGASILSFLLAPLEKVLVVMALISKSETLANAAIGISNFRKGLTAGVEAEIIEKGGVSPIVNPEATKQGAITERSEKIEEKRSSVELLIRDLTGRGELTGDTEAVPIMLQQTGGF